MAAVNTDPSKAQDLARRAAERAAAQARAAEAQKTPEAQEADAGQKTATENAVTEAAPQKQVDAKTKADARQQAMRLERARKNAVDDDDDDDTSSAASPSAASSPANAPARGIAPDARADVSSTSQGGGSGGVGLDFERDMAKFIAKRQEEDAKKAMEEAQKKAAQSGASGGGGAGGTGGSGGGSPAGASSSAGPQPSPQRVPPPQNTTSPVSQASPASAPAPQEGTGASAGAAQPRTAVSTQTPPSPKAEAVGTEAAPAEKAALEAGFQSRAQQLSADGAFTDVATQAFGAEKMASTKGDALAKQAEAGAVDVPQNVRFASDSELGGKNAAYSPVDGGTVTLNASLKNDPAALQNAYNEEVGHHLDHQLGGIDAKGDEGEIFSKGLEQGGPIAANELAAARADDDKGTLGGQAVEFQAPKTPRPTADLSTSRPQVRDAFGSALEGMTPAQRDGVQEAMDGLSAPEKTMAAELIGRQQLDRQTPNPTTDASTGAGKKLLDATTNSQPVAAPSLSHTANDGTQTIQHATGSTFQFSKDGTSVAGAGFSMQKQADGTWDVTRGQGETTTTEKFRGDVSKDANGNVKFSAEDGSSRTYDATGKVVDRNENGDVTGSLNVERRADGSETWKNQDGQLQRARDASGRTKAFHYDDSGKLDGIEITTPGAAATKERAQTDPTSTLYKRNDDGAWTVQQQQGQQPARTETTRGSASVDANGNVTFARTGGDHSSETFKSDGSTITKNAQDQVTRTETAAGDVSTFAYDATGAVSRMQTKDRTANRVGTGENPRWSDGQKGNVEVLGDGTVKTSSNQTETFSLTNGTSVSHDKASGVASLRDADGKLRASENAEGKGFGFGYDESGAMQRVVDTNTGNVWNRDGAPGKDGASTWRNQDGKSFQGSVTTDGKTVDFQMRDGLTGDKFTAKTNIASGKTAQTRFDGDTPVEVRHENGGVSARVKDSNGDWSNTWMQTWPPKTPGGKETKTIYENGQQRPFDDGALGEPNHARTNFNATKTAADIHRAVNPGYTGIGTDEAGLVKALDGLDDKQLAAVKAEYKTQYGQDMDKRVLSELSNRGALGGFTGDYDRVAALLKGDQAKADAVGIYQATQSGWTGLGTKESELLGILDRQTTPDQRKNLETAYQSYAKESLRSRLTKELGGPQLDQAKGLLDGDRAKARAAEIRHAMKGNGGAGTDEDAVYNGLSNLSASQRQRVIDKYQGMYGPTSSGALNTPPATSQLAKDIDGDFRGPQKDRAKALLNGDQALADAAKAKYAMHGDNNPLTFWDTLGTDEKSLNEAVATPGMKAAYDKQYGGTGAFDADRKSELGKGDLATNAEIEKTGTVSPQRQLWDAMRGAGTDEAKLLDVLGGRDGKGLTTGELKTLREDYATLTKEETGTARSLDSDVASELSGRPDHDAKQLLKGRPESLQGELARLNENHAYERKGWGNAVANGLNAVNTKGSNVDKFVDNANAAFARANADGKVTAAEEKEVRDWMQRADEGISTYREGRDALTDTVGTVATTAAVLGVAVASGGTLAGPALAGYAALAGAGANVASRWAVQGAGYQAGDAARDAFVGALEGATAGLGAGKLASAPFMAGMTNTAGGRFMARTLVGAADGALGGTVMGAGTAATSESNWDRGLGEGLLNMAEAGFQGGTLGALTGGTMANALPPVVTGLKKGYGKLRGTGPHAPAPDMPQVKARGDAPKAAPSTAPKADVDIDTPPVAPKAAPKVAEGNAPAAGDVGTQQKFAEAREAIDQANAKRELADRGRRRLQNDPTLENQPSRAGRTERRQDGTGGKNAKEIRAQATKLDREADALMDKARTKLNETLDAASTPDDIAKAEREFAATKPTAEQSKEFLAKSAEKLRGMTAPPGSHTEAWDEMMQNGDVSLVVDDLNHVATRPDATGSDLKEVANFAAKHADTIGQPKLEQIQQRVKDGVKRRGQEVLAEADRLANADTAAWMPLQAEMQDLSRAARKSGSTLAEVFAPTLDATPPSAAVQKHLQTLEKAMKTGQDPRLVVGSQAEADAVLNAWQQQHPSVDTTGMGPRKGRLFKGELGVHQDNRFSDQLSADGKPLLEDHIGTYNDGMRRSGPAKDHALQDATVPHYQIETPNGAMHIFYPR